MLQPKHVFNRLNYEYTVYEVYPIKRQIPRTIENKEINFLC